MILNKITPYFIGSIVGSILTAASLFVGLKHNMKSSDLVYNYSLSDYMLGTVMGPVVWMGIIFGTCISTFLTYVLLRRTAIEKSVLVVYFAVITSTFLFATVNLHLGVFAAFASLLIASIGCSFAFKK